MEPGEYQPHHPPALHHQHGVHTWSASVVHGSFRRLRWTTARALDLHLRLSGFDESLVSFHRHSTSGRRHSLHNEMISAIGREVLAAFQASISVLLVILYGALCTRWLKLLDSESINKITKVSTDVLLPCEPSSLYSKL